MNHQSPCDRVLLMIDNTLKALKTYIQIRFPSSTQKEEGFAELKSHINKDPPTVDLDTLNLLQQCLSELEESQFPDVVLQDVKALSALLWERAIKAKPGDEQLARQWFFSAFQHQNWRDAQKVLYLRTSFPDCPSGLEPVSLSVCWLTRLWLYRQPWDCNARSPRNENTTFGLFLLATCFMFVELCLLDGFPH